MPSNQVHSYRVSQFPSRKCCDCYIPGTRPGIYFPTHINSPFWNKLRNNMRKTKNQKHQPCTMYRPIQIYNPIPI